jgi:hypothetical protein
MAERYRELSSYLTQKSREYRTSGTPDQNEEENMILAISVALAVSISLITAMVTVFAIVASTR